MDDRPTITTGTLVWMHPRTDAKEVAIRAHGHLWVVVGHDPSRYLRCHVLKSVATGYAEHFNLTGLEVSNEECNQ